MLVEMYACNYDGKDGLVNYTYKIVKLYTHTDKVHVPWIKFHEPNICHQKFIKLSYLYTSEYQMIGHQYYEYQNWCLQLKI